MNVTIDNQQKVSCTISGVKSDGSPLNINSVVWTVISGDGELASTSGESNNLISGSDLADTVYQAAVTADFGRGTETVNQLITMIVVAPGLLPEGASINVAFGTPTLK